MNTPRPPEYHELVSMVRRFNGPALLRVLAQHNAALTLEAYGRRRSTRISVWDTRTLARKLPFVLGGVARTALISSAPHRDQVPTDKQIAQLANLFMDLDAPDLSGSTDETPAKLNRVLGRIAYEQFGEQQPLVANMARTAALLVDHASSDDEFPTQAEWEAELGCDLEHFMRIGFLLHAAAFSNAGAFSRDHLRDPRLAGAWAPLGVDSSMNVVERWFVTTLEDARRVGKEREFESYEKWSFNPLLARPLVDLGDVLVAPWPWLLLHRVTPTGLYYTGYELFEDRFTIALGHVFQAYIGTQFGLLGVDVQPEVEYFVGKDRKDTIDYFVIFDDLVLLVEVKAYRPAEDSRAGATEAGEIDTAKKLNKAFKQVQRTVDLIRDGHEAVAHIPTDRPLAAVVVTLEPFLLVNTDLVDDRLIRPDVPTAVASSLDLEQIVATLAGQPDAGSRVLAALTEDPRTDQHPDLTAAVDGLPPVPNPILESAWNRYFEPWTAMGLKGGDSGSAE